MATRGDAYRTERGPRGGPAAIPRESARMAAGAELAARAVRIADRYHLEDRISESGRSTLWRAFDDVLGRPVTVRTFGPGYSQAAEVVAAARASCRVLDHRLARVFDAHVAADGAYIVTEWPDGETLEDLLTLGHLDVGWVTRIVAEAASALAAAHAAGIAHRRLTPRSVRWSRDAGVKIVGLGIDAALADAVLADAAMAYAALADVALADTAPAGAPAGTAPAGAAPADVAPTPMRLAASADTELKDMALTAAPGAATPDALALVDTVPRGIGCERAADAARQAAACAETNRVAAALADTRALACVLYAALTGYWPGQQETALPTAPRRDGRPYRPRQVRAGVPARIDEITCRALYEPLPRDPPAVTTAGELAELLRGPLYYDLPPPATAAAPPHARFVDGSDGTDGAQGTDGQAAAISRSPLSRPRRRARRLAAGGVIGALFVIDSTLIGIAVMGAAHPPHVMRSVAHTQRPLVARPHRPPTRLLTPVSAQAFDPYGGNEDENSELAPAAIDGDPTTAWHTFWYTTQRFGNLKPGTGLVVDLGRSVPITNVRVQLGPVTGANVELRIGDSDESLSDMGVAATADDVGGEVSLQPGAAYRGRYVLIWFTTLPPDSDGGGVFQADIYNVAVYGS